MDRRLISISLQFDQFAGRGVDRGADLFLAVIGGDKEAEAGRAGGHCRRQDRLDVDAAGVPRRGGVARGSGGREADAD